MNNKKINLILIIIWMIFIFIMSNFNGENSSNQSGFFVNIISNILKIENTELLSIIIRKIAHFTEYLILAILIYNYNKRIYLTIIICIIYSLSDELHQLLVPDRVFNIYDIIIDSLGSLTGVYMTKLILKNRNT